MESIKPFSNQYILIRDKTLSPIDGWLTLPIDNGHLYYAPDLHCYKNENVTLLGFAIHVLHPEWDEQQIVEAFPSNESDILDYIDHLCGIHLIIVTIDDKTKVYHDAAAVMKIFCLKENKEWKAIASDPALLNLIQPLKQVQSEESKAFYRSDFFRTSCIRLGSQTQYENIEQVLPNHCIELNTGHVHRFFPRKRINSLPIQDAIDRTHRFFSNIMATTNRKYNIKCSMTAGWDSRMVLAMTKEHHKDIEYYTFMHPSFTAKHEDVKIPKRISQSLSLDHEFVSKGIRLDPNSLDVIKSSYDLMKTEKVDIYLGGFPKYRDDKNVLLVGTISEICKNYYDNTEITDGVSLTKAAHFPVMSYTTTYFDKKIKELKALQDEFGYDHRDIGHWEQDITNFAAKRTQYLNAFVRTFSPFNCRIVLQTMLSTPRELRDKQQHEFYRLYLDKFYPELLQFPVNPSLKQRLIRLGKKAGIYGAYKKLSTQLRK